MQQVHVIAIVDDDESVRVGTACLVKSLGYVAQAFPSAEAFLQSPDLGETSCLIADVQMPKMSGLELQERLREMGMRIPVILITAYPEERVRRRALEAGAIAFLDKPFTGATLIEHLGAALIRGDDPANGA